VSFWQLLAVGSLGVGVVLAVRQMLCAGARYSHEIARSRRRINAQRKCLRKLLELLAAKVLSVGVGGAVERVLVARARCPPESAGFDSLLIAEEVGSPVQKWCRFKMLWLLARKILGIAVGGTVGRVLRILECDACSNSPRAPDRPREDRLACNCSGSLVWLEVKATA
jgi:hypothetical protein